MKSLKAYRIPRFYYSIKGKIWRLKRYIKHFVTREIVLRGYIFYDQGEYLNNNFGDDINIPLLNYLTKRPIVLDWQTGLSRIHHLLCIGSIIESSNCKSVIWGSGSIAGKSVVCKPKKICAVRGPLTRSFLINQGIKCPPIYGDPALLLPYIYKPKTKKIFKIGIIPHYVDYNLPHVEHFRNNNPNILFIRMQGYESWQNVIEQICSCEIIISSSLHGLIVSDAYGVPNVRVQFSDEIVGGDFKYKDYFYGVGRTYSPPIDFRSDIKIDLITEQINSYVPIRFNPKELLEAFPYSIDTKVKRNIRKEFNNHWE